MSLDYSANLIPLAKTLRKNPTPQERRLWYDFLRTYPVRFQRQKTIGSFIVDFYCHKARLVIEIDGSQHFDEQGIERDKARTEFLDSFGLRVIRFSNADVDQRFRAVCESIDLSVKERYKSET